MAVYTLSLNFFRHLCEQESNIYFFNILSVFANDRIRHKLAIDKDAIILDRYREVEKNKELIMFWINSLVDRQPLSRFIERTNADISTIDDDELMCLEICSATQGQKKLIVYSKSSLRVISVNSNDDFIYHGVIIHVLDKDDASDDMTPQEKKIEVTAIDSQVAGGNIIDSQNH